MGKSLTLSKVTYLNPRKHRPYEEQVYIYTWGLTESICSSVRCGLKEPQLWIGS